MSYPKKLHVKVKVKALRLEGLNESLNEEEMKMMFIQLKWKGPKSRNFIPFYRFFAKKQTKYGSFKISNAESLIAWEWDDEEFENLCSFSIKERNGSFDFVPWYLTFTVLCGKKGGRKGKEWVMGKVCLDLGELASKKEPLMESKLPLTSNQIEASLLVDVSFSENVKSKETVVNKGPLLKFGRSLTGKQQHKKKNLVLDDQYQEAFRKLEWRSPTNSVPEVMSASGSSTPETKPKLFSWKKRRLSFGGISGKYGDWLTSRRSKSNADELPSHLDPQKDSQKSPETDHKDKGLWVLENIVSRADDETILHTQVFYASFDQTSEEAGGESACAVIVALIANWFNSNPQQLIPTEHEFNCLIIEGSSRWRTLCGTEHYATSFPNKHFDLDTIIKSKTVPLTLSTDNSLTGAFSPDKFESIKDDMSFDEIWDAITRYGPAVYIVSWNDHFFAVKMGVQAHYLIDSLGKRLHIHCDKAYILKFEESSVMTRKEGTICKGKECLGEYIKRFLAARIVRELEGLEEASRAYLLPKLQIDFYCCSRTPTD